MLVFNARKMTTFSLGEGSVDPPHMLQGEGSSQPFLATDLIYFSLSVLLFN